MGVNGVTGVSTAANAYGTYSAASQKSSEVTTETKKQESEGVVYDKSGDKVTGKKYTQNAELVAKLKADAEAKEAQFRSLVEQMMTKQGSAIGNADSMWKFLAGGNFTVTAAAKAQAEADIAEDGYWGVNKTSDRILEFAKALTGGDPAKAEEMRSAFEKGFKEATGTWGKKLPDISSNTYDAVMKKFDDWAKEGKEESAV